MKTPIFLKVILVWILYRLKWKEQQEWTDNKIQWRFEFEPKKFNIVIMVSILSMFIIVYGGIKALKETYKGTNKIQSWSSYRFYLPEGEKPSNYQAYKKF